MIVISRNLVLSEVQSYDADNAVVGWRNIVTTANISADTEATAYPATNLANPNTSLEWRANDTTEQYLTVLTDTIDAIDYLAVARHNFGSQQIPVSVEGRTVFDGAWTELVQDVLLEDDAPVLFRFEPQSLYEIRLRLQSGDAAARAAVLYAGPLLVMERGIYVGHTPLKYGRRTNVVNGRAESGDFLGRIVIGEHRESAAKFSLIDPAWYRNNLDAFVGAAQETPFFFAWRPTTYPRELGFAVVTNDPVPVPADPSHLLEIEFQMRGVA